jgi:hypothetical protein
MQCRASFSHDANHHNRGEIWGFHGGEIRVLDDRAFKYRQGLGTFPFTPTSRPILGPIQWIPGALSLGVKRPGREADSSPPSSAEFTNVWSYTSIPPIRLHSVVLSWSTGITLPLPYVLLGCDGKIPAFQKSALPPSSRGMRKTEEAWPSETLASYSNNTRRHNSELNLHNKRDYGNRDMEVWPL